MKTSSWGGRTRGLAFNPFFGPNVRSRRKGALSGRRPAAAAHVESLEERVLLSSVSLVDMTPPALGSFDTSPPSHGGCCCPGCAFVSQPATTVAAAGVATGAPPFALGDTFKLHSLTGADLTIYLDFDGHTTSGTSWNSQFNNNQDFVSPAYDGDGTPGTFTAAELEFIQRVWQRVAEDFAPFNVNVTTEDPGVERLRKSGAGDTQWGVRSIQTGDQSWIADTQGNSGGWGYYGSFAWDTDTPVFTFNGSGSVDAFNEKASAETHSHEVGHSLGLRHDGRTTGTPPEEYYGGHGSGATSWGPIMGGPFNAQVTHWSKGEYPNASQLEDDLRVITDPTLNGGFGQIWSGLTYRADDHADEDFGTVGSESTQLSFVGGAPSGSGLISTSGDIDSFWFDWAGGSFSVFLSPAERGPNLDILARIYNTAGLLIASSNPAEALNASFVNLALAAGRYYLRIDGIGKPPGPGSDVGYSDYASLGRYTISGSDPTEDRYEENDTRLTAVDPRQSLGPVVAVGEWEGTWLSAISGPGKMNDDDWYAIEVTAGYLRVVAEMTLVDDEGDIDLQLVNSSGVVVASALTSSDLERIDFVVSSPGRYYLRAFPWAGVGPKGNSYDLRWDDIATSTPSVTVAVVPAAATEDGTSPLVFTFTRTGETNSSLTVNYDIRGTAFLGSDYTQTGTNFFSGTSGNVVFAAGSSTATITIDPTADGLVEADETVQLNLVAGGGYSVGAASTATGTITNDDAAPTVTAVRYGYGINNDKWTTTAALGGRIAPWEVTRIQVTFSRDVSVDATDLIVSRLIAPLGTLATTGFNYDAPTRTATWTLTVPIREDRIRITIDGDGPNGVQGGGAFLVGGDFLDARLDVLFGDVNGSGEVTVADAVLARNAINTADAYADVNGNGMVTVADAVLVRNRINAKLPLPAGSAAPEPVTIASSPYAGSTATRTAPQSTVTVLPVGAPSPVAFLSPGQNPAAWPSERDRALEFVFAAIGAAKEEGLAEALLTGVLPKALAGRT